MAEPNVTELPKPLPESITVSANPNLRLTPNEMRRLKKETGRSLTELMGEEADDSDRVQAMIWLQLARDGHTLTWDEAGDVAIEYEAPEPDPT